MTATSQGRIAALDGWRGIAILVVLFEHVCTAFNGRYTHAWMHSGQHGVTIFFVLSGFLITSRLLDKCLDPPALKRFYIRRCFRLMPVAWAYLAFLVLFDLISGAHATTLRETWSALFFYRNYLGPGGGANEAGHFWSLSVEEQFYLAWPLSLMFLGYRKARWFAIAGAVTIAAYRYSHWAQYDHQWLSFHTEVRADALLIGCLLALFLNHSRTRAMVMQLSRFLALPASATLIFCFVHYHWLPPLYECVSIACLIAATTLHPASIAARALSSQPLAWIGTVSYSIYVWQQIFLTHYTTASTTVVMMCLMPFFALGSYYGLELPFTRLAHRLTVAPMRQATSANEAQAQNSPIVA